MKIKEDALQVLEKAGELLKDPQLSDVMSAAVSSKTDMTWLDMAQTILPIAIESVENCKIELPAKAKNAVVSSIVLPLIKDKLPWYVKPFASKLISWFIDVIVAALNKLFTKKWGEGAEEIAEHGVETLKAEGTL